MEPINIRDLLKDAQKNNYAIAAINANGATYDIARAILEGANDEKVPVIIQAYEHNMEYRGYEYFVLMVKHLARDLQVPSSRMSKNFLPQWMSTRWPSPWVPRTASMKNRSRSILISSSKYAN